MTPRKPRSRVFIWLIAAVICLGALLMLYRRRPKPPLAATAICTPFKHVAVPGRGPAFVADKKYRWPNETTINVYFDAGDNALTEKIIAVANEWHQYCYMQFKLVTHRYDAQVKVSFAPKGYGSAIGIECKNSFYDTEPSMYLQGFDTLRSQVTFRRVVLHEFGHVLGLDHELSNPTAVIPWDTAEVYKFYKKYNHWDSTMVNEQIFERLDPEQIVYGKFDPASIMVYAIQPPLTKGLTIPWPKRLSADNIQRIGQWYPLHHR